MSNSTLEEEAKSEFGEKEFVEKYLCKAVEVAGKGVVAFTSKKAMERAIVLASFYGVIGVGTFARGAGSFFGKFIGTWAEKHATVIQIFNMTDYEFKFSSSTFNSGRFATESECGYDTSEISIPKTGAACICARSKSWACAGVSGYIVYKNEEVGDMYLAFSNPLCGTSKVGVGNTES